MRLYELLPLSQLLAKVNANESLMGMTSKPEFNKKRHLTNWAEAKKQAKMRCEALGS